MRGAGGSGPGAGQASGDGVHGHDGQGKPKLLEREATVSSIQRNARKRVVGWGGVGKRSGTKATFATGCSNRRQLLPACQQSPSPSRRKAKSLPPFPQQLTPCLGRETCQALPHRPQRLPFRTALSHFPTRRKPQLLLPWRLVQVGLRGERDELARSPARLSLASDAKATPVGSDCCSLLAPNSE